MSNLQKNEKRKWYVLVTKPRFEKKVGECLTKGGIENFVPLQWQLRQWKDRKKWVEMPLLFSYIFVKTEDKFRFKVFDVIGIVRYVHLGSEVAVMTEQEMERVRRLCSYRGNITIAYEEVFNVGDEIEITEGHFAGLFGRLLENGSSNRLKISIPGLRCVATVEIEKDKVKKV